MVNRYETREGSELGHGCCFDATVVDTLRQIRANEYAVVCECFDMELANRICVALNDRERH